ncbi:hypothetical protein IFM89_024678 [Coptis chinensis]|uniref:Pectinesterase catalytic domain-containing protein n=1 Tax=Coptis chinensis TaxID=261450 RepID=A0A835IES1_9MAGN|nr:hypothetical protein IFM89_024678 [Coptis chinensis]
MSGRVNDLKTWSSAIIALKTTCLDDLLEKPGLQKTMQDEFMNATQITFSAIAIVDEISQILSKVNSTEFPRLISSFMEMHGPSEIVVIASDNKKINNTQTWRTATFFVEDGFIASSMGFENIDGPEGEQAVAF